MGHAKHIGRVGALAIALGIGVAVASTAGEATAAPAAPGTTSSSSHAPAKGAANPSSTAAAGPSGSAPSKTPESTTGQVTSPSGSATSSVSSHPAERPARPGLVVATGGTHTNPPTGTSPSSGTTARIAAKTSAPDTPRATARARTTETKGIPVPETLGGQHEVGERATITGRSAPAQRTTKWEAPDSRAAKTTHNTPARTNVPAPDKTTPANRVDATGVVVVTVQPSAPTTPSGASTTTAAVVSTPIGEVLTDNAPTTPLQAPTLWTLFALARRDFDRTFSNQGMTSDQGVALNPRSGAVTNGLVADAPIPTIHLIDPASRGEIGASSLRVSVLTVDPRPDAPMDPARFTGQPSIVNQVFIAAYRVVRAFTDFTDLFGLDTSTLIAKALSSDRPPWLATLGLNVQRSEFQGMPVWTLQSPRSSVDKYVVGIHGGAFMVHPNIFNWLDYAAMARDTGATVVVPIYPLAPQGTAGTVIPVMADLISSEIDQHGAENVSLYGDSAGGNISLVSVQELVRRGDPVPSHMVLLSPALDLTFSNPAMQFIDDPLLNITKLPAVQQWAGELDLTDPLVSPLYGSLAGLPPTAAYFGDLDLLAPDGLLLQDHALATPGADFTFILRKGEIHNWAAFEFLPETAGLLPDIYRQLGIG